MTQAVLTEENRKIHVKRRGNALGFGIFGFTIRVFGLWGAYFILYFVCLHYLIFDRAAVRVSMAYVEKRFKTAGWLGRYFHVYLLFVSQGQQLIDRYVGMEKPGFFDIRTDGYEKIDALLRDSSQGAILLTGHCGNWQLAMTGLKDLGKTVYLLMRPEDNPAVHGALGIDGEQDHLKIISPEQHLGGILSVMKVIEEGHLVAIMGDRSYGFGTVEVPFLQSQAHFPFGAFSIAAAAKCPIIMFTAKKESGRQYAVNVAHVFYPEYTSDENKQSQIRKWVAKYVSLLEDFIRQFPYQCFLFHNVWTDKKGNV